jgi:hypothetical protein
MDKSYIRSIYRRLWRASHIAIHNRPAPRHAIRAKLRHAFRTETSVPSELEVTNTEAFLRTAGRRRGVENRVVKALCHVDWDRMVNKRYYS